MRRDDEKFLTIFHMDMNHVCLREDYIRKWLDCLAEMGYTAILWELEDKVCWDTCRAAIWSEAMTKDQFRTILEYASEIGLESIPLLQTVGHGEYILKHQMYAHMRELSDRYDCYCTSNPDVRDFFKDLINEYLELFGDIRHFHLGGDEAYVFGSCPKCSALSKQTSPNKIYSDHILDIAQPIFDRNIRPGIWCDMVLHYPDDLKFIPKDLTIWDWNYWDGTEEPQVTRIWGDSGYVPKEHINAEMKKTFPEIIDSNGKLRSFYTVDVLQRLGYDVFLCSSARCWGDGVFCGIHSTHSTNVVGAAQKANSSNLLGHCVTSWAVRIFSLELQQIWIALAAKCNLIPNASYAEIAIEVGRDILGISPLELYEAIEKIAAPIPFAVSGPFSGIQWTGMKDSIPAPNGHVKNIFDNWKKEKNGEKYVLEFNELKRSFKKIEEGKVLLENIAVKIDIASGRKFVNEWLKAADFQIRMAKIIERAFLRYENDFSQIDETYLAETARIKKDFEVWARQWMTPESAMWNSDLIFNPLIEWFSANSLECQTASKRYKELKG